MDAIAKLETIKLKVDERRLKHSEGSRKYHAAKKANANLEKRKLEQLMIANANLEQAARKVAASAAALRSLSVSSFHPAASRSHRASW